MKDLLTALNIILYCVSSLTLDTSLKPLLPSCLRNPEVNGDISLYLTFPHLIDQGVPLIYLKNEGQMQSHFSVPTANTLACNTTTLAPYLSLQSYSCLSPNTSPYSSQCNLLLNQDRITS